MSNELQAPLGLQYAGLTTVYALIVSGTSQVWNTSGKALDPYATFQAAANWANYAIACGETVAGKTGKYVASAPVGGAGTLPAGDYSIEYYVQSGATAAPGDLPLAIQSLAGWNGTAAQSIGVSLPAAAAGAAGGLATVNGSNQVAGVSGNILGSVASVAGNVVGSVSSVVGSVGSVAAAVTTDISALATTALPNAAPGTSGGLPTTNSSNQVAGVSGNVTGSVGSVAAAVTTDISGLATTALPAVLPGHVGGIPLATNLAGSGVVPALFIASDGSTNLNMAQVVPTSPAASSVGRFFRSVKARLLGVALNPVGNVETFQDDAGNPALSMTYDNIAAPSQRTTVAER